MWLVFSALSGAFYTGEGLLQRFLLRGKKDAWAFSFFYSLIGSLVSLPFMLSAPRLPHSAGPWLLAAAMGLVIVGHNLLVFKASHYLEPSVAGSLSKLRLVWIFILGIVFLGNSFSWAKLAGTLLTVAAGVVIIHRFKRPESAAGVSLILSATVLNASIIILSKYLLRSFNVASFTFFVSFLPAAIFNFVLMPQAPSRITKLFKAHARVILLACGLGAFANLALNQALSLHDATSVVVITEVFLVLVLVGEHALLKEKEQVWVKLVSVLLAVSGAILIQIRL